MKVRNNERFTPLNRRDASTPTTRKGNANLFSLFSSELKSKKAESDAYDVDINSLRKEIDTAGQLLEHEPTVTNFKKFRELLSSLAKRVTNEAYRLEKIGGTPMNPRYYEIITVIDSEAEKLYQMVIKEQKDRMAITASVIGIKGLIVDLLT